MAARLRFWVHSCVMAAMFFAFIPSMAWAAWPNDPFTNVPIVTATGSQAEVNAVTDGAGGAYVAWLDVRSGNYDVYLQHILAGGTIAPGWPVNGAAVCTAPGLQDAFDLAPDGLGNALLVWSDQRSGVSDIYGQRVLANGTIAPGWAANGTLICGAAGSQFSANVCRDSAGGMYCAWGDLRGANQDIYVQHLSAAGAIYPGWAANGNGECTAAGGQIEPAIAFDGGGGANLAWQDHRVDGAGDIYALRIKSAGLIAPGWPVNGVAICSAIGGQISPRILSDGAGGEYIVWADHRGGADYDIYARGVGATGTPVWAADGVALCTAIGDQTSPSFDFYDNGVIVAWEDHRGVPVTIATQAITNYGVIPPNFVANGVSVAPSVANQFRPVVMQDGVGGIYFIWYENRFGSSDIFMQRFGPNYSVYTGWLSGGLRVSGENGDQRFPVTVLSNDESVIAAWDDLRNGNSDVYAQRVDRFGRLGQPEPTIAGIHDVKSDQGGHVRVDWNASYLDASPSFEVGSYAVWRQVPASVAQSALRAGARLVRTSSEAAASSGRALRTSGTGAATVYWEFLASLQARGLAGYSYTAATTTDSTSSGNPYTQFMIEADASATIAFWMSAADSGYSVDNIAPAPPSAFTAQYFPGSAPGANARAMSTQAQPYAWLHWAPASEADVMEYRVHRGNTSNFTPSTANLVVAKPDTGYIDLGAAPSYYKLITVDTHGNQSQVSTALPENVLGVEDGGSITRLAFLPPRPNPVRATCKFTIELPSASEVRLEIYDIAGRSTRVLASGSLEAGPHEISWDGRDASGRRLPGGLYFARLYSRGTHLVRRVVVLDP